LPSILFSVTEKSRLTSFSSSSQDDKKTKAHKAVT
jgi:hypothetical protein